MGLDGFQAVLLDLDGVLLDSMQQHARLWQELFAAQGFELPLEYIMENEGALDAEAVLRYLQAQGRLGSEAQELHQRMEQLLERQAGLYLEHHAGRVRPFPGARRLLEGLERAGLPRALVTSSRRQVVERCLPSELRELLPVRICAEDVSAYKPHPEPYLTAAARLGVEPSSCLVVENAPAGIASARAAGATCYAVCSTLPPEKLSGAQRVFPDLEALIAALGL